MKGPVSLKKFVSVPGSTKSEIFKNFYTEKHALKWLEDNGYKSISDRWEKESEQEYGALEVWVYIKIVKLEIE